MQKTRAGAAAAILGTRRLPPCPPRASPPRVPSADARLLLLARHVSRMQRACMRAQCGGARSLPPPAPSTRARAHTRVPAHLRHARALGTHALADGRRFSQWR